MIDARKLKVGDMVKYGVYVFIIYHIDEIGAYGHSKTSEKDRKHHNGSSSGVRTPSKNGYGCWNFWFDADWGIEKVNIFKGNV